jgi:hypothetical protein
MCLILIFRSLLGVDQLFGKIDDGFAKGLMRSVVGSVVDWDLSKPPIVPISASGTRFSAQGPLFGAG